MGKVSETIKSVGYGSISKKLGLGKNSSSSSGSPNKNNDTDEGAGLLQSMSGKDGTVNVADLINENVGAILNDANVKEAIDIARKHFDNVKVRDKNKLFLEAPRS